MGAYKMSIFDEFDEIINKMKRAGGGASGYSISVVYGPDGKPIVNVETYGDVNKEELRREIERMYPGAEIRGLDKEPLIKEDVEVDRRAERRKPLIWEDDSEEETK